MLFIGSVCLSVCVCVFVKSHLTYGASVHPENAVTYSAGNEGQNICGVFSENAPLLRSSGAAIVFHTFRWPFFFIAKVVRMCISIHSYACRTAREYPACPTIVDNIQPCPKLVGARTDSTTRYSYNARRGQFPQTHIGIVHKTGRNACSSMRQGFCTLVLFILIVTVASDSDDDEKDMSKNKFGGFTTQPHNYIIISLYGNGCLLLIYTHPAHVNHGTVDTDSDDAEPRSRKKSKISQRENGITTHAHT